VSEKLNTMNRDGEINTKHWQDIIDQRANDVFKSESNFRSVGPWRVAAERGSGEVAQLLSIHPDLPLTY